MWQAGCACHCPHTNTRFFDKAAPDAVFLDGDLEILRRCDFVILVPGWERSQGTLAEINAAVSQGLPIFPDVASLRRWLATPATS